LKEGVEFDIYKDSPHLQRPIVDKPEGAIEALREMGSEIDRRMALLRSTRAKDISETIAPAPMIAFPSS